MVDVNLLRQSVKVRMEEQPETIGCFHNCEIWRAAQRQGQEKRSANPRRFSPPFIRRRQAAQKGPGRGRAAYASGPHPLPLPPRRHCGGGAAPGGSAPPQERGSESLKMPQSPFPRSSPEEARPKAGRKARKSKRPQQSPAERRQPPPSPAPKSPIPPSPGWKSSWTSSMPCRTPPTSPAATAAAVPPTPNALKWAAYPQSPRETVR